MSAVEEGEAPAAPAAEEIPAGNPEDIAKNPTALKEAQEEMATLDVLVCGQCHSAFHFVEEFKEHKEAGNCSGKSPVRDSNESKAQVWAFLLWKCSSSKDDNSWKLYQQWCRMPEAQRNAWNTAGANVQALSKFAHAQVTDDQQVPVQQTPQTATEKKPRGRPRKNAKMEESGEESDGHLKVSPGQKVFANKTAVAAQKKRKKGYRLRSASRGARSGRAQTLQRPGSMSWRRSWPSGSTRGASKAGEYVVEKILAKRFNPRRKQYEYLLKWEGYPHEQNTWEPVENMETCKHLLEAFEKQLARQKELKALKAQQQQQTPVQVKHVSTPLPQVVKQVVKKVNDSPALTPTGRLQRTSKARALDQVKAWCGAEEEPAAKKVKRELSSEDDDYSSPDARLLLKLKSDILNTLDQVKAWCGAEEEPAAKKVKRELSSEDDDYSSPDARLLLKLKSDILNTLDQVKAWCGAEEEPAAKKVKRELSSEDDDYSSPDARLLLKLKSDILNTLDQVKAWCGAEEEPAAKKVKAWCGAEEEPAAKKVKRELSSEDDDYSSPDARRESYKLKSDILNTLDQRLDPELVKSLELAGCGVPNIKGVIKVDPKHMPNLTTGVYIMSKSSGIMKIDSPGKLGPGLNIDQEVIRKQILAAKQKKVEETKKMSSPARTPVQTQQIKKTYASGGQQVTEKTIITPSGQKIIQRTIQRPAQQDGKSPVNLLNKKLNQKIIQRTIQRPAQQDGKSPVNLLNKKLNQKIIQRTIQRPAQQDGKSPVNLLNKKLNQKIIQRTIQRPAQQDGKSPVNLLNKKLNQQVTEKTIITPSGQKIIQRTIQRPAQQDGKSPVNLLNKKLNQKIIQRTIQRPAQQDGKAPVNLLNKKLNQQVTEKTIITPSGQKIIQRTIQRPAQQDGKSPVNLLNKKLNQVGTIYKYLDYFTTRFIQQVMEKTIITPSGQKIIQRTIQRPAQQDGKSPVNLLNKKLNQVGTNKYLDYFTTRFGSTSDGEDYNNPIRSEDHPAHHTAARAAGRQVPGQPTQQEAQSGRYHL
ncbi:hypothetical protein NE865_03701 [Phthorimaea operculella]|nr:hypothetical protein NE865_03701 [Phthorimaea operculella]